MIIVVVHVVPNCRRVLIWPKDFLHEVCFGFCACDGSGCPNIISVTNGDVCFLRHIFAHPFLVFPDALSTVVVLFRAFLLLA